MSIINNLSYLFTDLAVNIGHLYPICLNKVYAKEKIN